MKRLRILASILLFLVLVAVLASCARSSAGPVTTSEPDLTPDSIPTITPDSILWESMGGPPGAGSVLGLIQNPSGSHELYTLTQHGDVYRSEDKGESWQLIKGLEGIHINSMVVYNDKLFIGGDGVRYCDSEANPIKVFEGWCDTLVVSDHKLFLVQPGKDIGDLRILFTDLTTGEFNWEDIPISVSALSGLSIPSGDSGLKCGINISDIHAQGERILVNIIVKVEGSGELTNGRLYLSDNLGRAWSEIKLDVPDDVIISNMIQDTTDPEHILLLFRHPILHDATYPVSELIRESYNGGKTWNSVTDCTFMSNGITGVGIQGSTYYLLSPYDGYILKLAGSKYERMGMPWVKEFKEMAFNLDTILFDYDNPDIVYGKTGDVWALGLVKSEDGMRTWKKMDSDIVASSPTIVLAHPTEPDTIFTSGNIIQESYYTRDRGETWEPFTPITAGDEVRIDPHNPEHILLVDEMTNIYESYDSGRTFTQIAENFSSAKVFDFEIAQDGRIYVSNIGVGISEYNPSEGDGWRYMTDSPDYAYDIEIDPDDSNILYAAYSPKVFETHSSIWRYSRYQEENSGWAELLRVEDSRGITSLEFDPANSNRLYAGVVGEEGTIYVSNDKGETWGILNKDLTFTTIWGHSQLQIDPRDKNTVYAGTWGGGTYKTTDGGKDWLLLDEEHTFSPTGLAIAESNPDVIYACDRIKPLIHRSDDGGKTWYTYYDFGEDYMLTSAVAIDPDNPDLIYVAAFKPPMAHGGGLVKIESGRVIVDLSAGLPRAVLDIALDKNDLSVIYVTTHLHGVFKSTNGGNTWKQLDDRGTGLPRTGMYDIDVDPFDSNILYTTALCGELPDYMMAPGIANLEGKCGVYKSIDGGENWILVLETISEARGIDIDPNDSRNLYVADMMGGVWVSNDSGQYWRRENDGLGSISMTSVRVKDDHVYASTQGSGVYSGIINLDGSIVWDEARSNKPKAYVHRIRIEVDLVNSNRIYASAYPGGLLRSDDGGQNWNDKNFLTPSIRVDDPSIQGYYSFDTSPHNPENVWMGVYGKGVFVSYDGMDFNMFANGDDRMMMDRNVTSISINPCNQDEIYVGTQEGVFVTQDKGRHWEELNEGLDTLDIRSLKITSIESQPFVDSFEVGGADKWQLEEGWSVIQESGNCVLQGTGHRWARAGSESWANYTFQTRLKLLQGAIHVNFRNCNEGRYFLGFREDGLSLIKQFNQWAEFADLTANQQPYELNRWYNLRIEVEGGNIKVYVDGILRIEYTDSKPLLNGSIAFETLDDSRVHVDDVYVDLGPAQSVVYAGTAGYGVYRLDPATKQWHNLGGTLGGGYWSPWERRMYQFISILFDPDIPGRIYLGHFPSGFFISEDNGHAWKDSSLGLGNDGMFSLSMHPHNHDILFAGTYNGVMKSVDRGRTWQMKSNGMPEEQWPYTVAIDSYNPDIMYTSTKSGQNKGFCSRNDFCGVVMKSTDGSESWFKIMGGLDDRCEFYTLLIFPLNHDILILSTNQGVYLSTDAGESWEAINNGLPGKEESLNINNQVRDNVADNLALTPDNRYLILGLMNHGVWIADLQEP